MILWESVRLALIGLSAQKLRSFLTTLGIIIGVAAVITLVAVGQGTARQVEAQIQQLGSNLIMVTPNRAAGGRLEISDAQQILLAIPQVIRAVPTVTGSYTVKSGTATYDTTLEGVGADFPEVRDFSMAQGQFFTSEDVQYRRKVVVLGPTVAQELFGVSNPVGQTVRISGQTFTVLGVTAEKGSSFGGDNDDRLWIPVTAAQRLTGSRWLNRLDLQARTGEEAVAAQLVEGFYVGKLRREGVVRVQSMSQILDTMSNVVGFMTVMLGAIAGISLVVGGIGIMNIMLVSVSERTREIGLRKALGARRKDIMNQFLVEALMLSLIGGAGGILLGYGGATLIDISGLIQTSVSLQAVWLAFGFAAAVGVFFGLYPAVKAANLDPIEALRRE